MANVLGQLLPLAVGVAISPVPIIAAILMLLAPRSKRTSVGFLVGWVAGILVASTVFVVIASVSGLDDTASSPSATSCWIKVILGALLLLVALRQWRSRPKPGEEAALPKWMAMIDSLSFVKAMGLAFALAAVNPKNLLLCAAAGTAIGGSEISLGDTAVAVALFTIVASCSVAGPVIAFLAAHQRMARPLDELRAWLQANNATVMSVLLLVLGVVLIGKGISGL